MPRPERASQPVLLVTDRAAPQVKEHGIEPRHDRGAKEHAAGRRGASTGDEPITASAVVPRAAAKIGVVVEEGALRQTRNQQQRDDRRPARGVRPSPHETNDDVTSAANPSQS